MMASGGEACPSFLHREKLCELNEVTKKQDHAETVGKVCLTSQG